MLQKDINGMTNYSEDPGETALRHYENMPCNIQNFFSAVKIVNFVGKNLIFIIF